MALSFRYAAALGRSPARSHRQIRICNPSVSPRVTATNALRPHVLTSQQQQYLRLIPARQYATEEPEKITSPPPKSDRELRKEISGKAPRFMGLWVLIGISGLAASMVYYLNESDQEERKVDKAVKMLEGATEDVQLLGLESLADCLFAQKRLLSGSVDIPQPMDLLIERGVVESLMKILNNTKNNEIKYNAIVWLIRLCDEEEARKRINALGYGPIVDTVKKADTSGPLWLISATFFLEMAQYHDSFQMVGQPQVMDALKSVGSGHPLSKLMGAVISSMLIHRGVDVPDIGLGGDLEKLTNPASIAALAAAIKKVTPPEPIPKNPLLGSNALYQSGFAAAFGLVGMVWGRFRWGLHARLKGLRSSDQLYKLITKRCKTGRYVFALLAMDVLAQALMAWPKEGLEIPFVDEPIKLPEVPGNLSPLTVIPIGEATLATTVGLWAVYRQRYVVLPLFLASCTAYWDHIDYYLRPYAKIVGVDEYMPRGALTAPAKEE